MKSIVLCADDYGQAEAISLGIIELIEAGRLTATSCMTNTPDWPSHAKWLVPLQERVDVGLHINLTEGVALSEAYRQAYGSTFWQLPRLLKKAFFHQLDKKIILAECMAQVDCFERELGCLPRFIDGHEHVHQFPIIREAVIELFAKRMPSNTFVRLINEKIGLGDVFYTFKKLIIKATGTHAMQRLLKQHAIPHNPSFAGIYNFARSSHYRDLFREFLAKIENGGLIMCHPGLSRSDDPIGQARYDEYRYFESNAFLDDCKEAGVNLTHAKS